MYVRDHQCPAFHKALGLGIDDYARRVLTLTSEITRQCFPLELDLDNPKMWGGSERLTGISAAMDAAKRRGGLAGRIALGWHGGRGAATFARLYLLPVKSNALPASSRLEPVW